VTSPLSDRAQPGFDLTAEKAYYLQRTQVLEDLETELTKWGKHRFWIIAVLAVLVGLFGAHAVIRGLVDSQLRDAARASAEAEAAARAARESTARAQAAVESYEKTVAELRNHATDVDIHYRELDAKLASRSENVRNGIQLAQTEFDLQLANLKSAIATLLHDVKGSRSAENFDVEVNRIRESSQTRTASFAENSRYRLTFSYLGPATPQTRAAILALRAAGFLLEDYPNSDYAKDERDNFPGHAGTLSRSTHPIVAYHPSAQRKAEEVRDILHRVVGYDNAVFIQDANMRELCLAAWEPAK
jgi:hypothetical protein